MARVLVRPMGVTTIFFIPHQYWLVQGSRLKDGANIKLQAFITVKLKLI
jgi:hypothetical protein